LFRLASVPVGLAILSSIRSALNEFSRGSLNATSRESRQGLTLSLCSGGSAVTLFD
jgi:hypothetical protein